MSTETRPNIAPLVLSWDDVTKLIDRLLPQFDCEYQTMVVITRGGIIPGGLLAETMDISTILTASVDFPAQWEFRDHHAKDERFTIWPKFLQFPGDELLQGQNVLIVDDVWGSGRTISSVKIRVECAGGNPTTCVLHFNPYRNLFGQERPDHYADITDRFIIYPWETHRGKNTVLYPQPE
ncbi:MAG: phosphoribosyltransferase [Anaerolineae bacterium]|nr:phosphoribosyltransferase [Anaerolineae bacterium]